MATEETFEREGQFHCVRCNSVFSAPLSLGRPRLCSICGNSPQRDVTYASVSDITTSVDADGNHGVPGKDIADFVSMKMVRRKRQVKWAIAAWCALLVGVAGLSVYLQNREKPLQAEGDKAAEEIAQLRKKTAEAYRECLQTYSSFIKTSNYNERSQFVVNGVDKLLKLQAYYGTSIEPVLVGDTINVGVTYNDDGEYPCLQTIVADKKKQPYELVFWDKGDGWRLDWEQHVRYQGANWTEFLLDPQIGESELFKLYVRKRYSSDEGEALRLIFYQPRIIAGARGQESPQITVEKGHPAYASLKSAFEKLEEKAEARTPRVIGHKDPTGMLRVKAVLSFRQASQDSKPELQLDEVKAFHWMEYDPAEE